MEIICAMVYQLTKDLSMQEIKDSGFDLYYVDHTTAAWPQAAGGLTFSAIEFQSKGDAICDLTGKFCRRAESPRRIRKPFTRNQRP